METTAEGEYIPSKELNTNFKIPRKRSNSTDMASYQQVMDNNYFNYAAAFIPQSTQNVVSPYEIEAARHLILQSLQKRNTEKPKTYQNHILEDTIPDLFDESLPRDLTSLFQPLYCKLCSTQLSSNVVAKLHYKSKNHEKKIRKYLMEHSEKTGEPLHKRARVVPKVKQVEVTDNNPLYFYCDVCDLPLTGKQHAESHYMGKNHRRATLGMTAPAGKGHYDESGKWVREGSSQKRSHAASAANNSGDNFGKAFLTAPAVANPPTVSAPPPPPIFRCELCNVTTTCREQLECHYNGQKHRKRAKQATWEGWGQTEEVIKGDCSVYRTPSGQYYCQVCNASSNSEMQFKQHLHSKNHLKKVVTQKKA